MKNKLKNYLKLGIFLFGITLIIVNCQKEDTETFNEQVEQNVFEANQISIDDVPAIGSLLQKTGKSYSSRTAELSCGTIDLNNILQVTHLEEEKTNYSFLFTNQYEENDTVLYNYVITDKGDGVYGEFILKYTPDDAFLSQYSINNPNDISNFSGQLDIYSYSDFCQSSSSLKTTTFTTTTTNPPCASTDVASGGSTGGLDTSGGNNNGDTGGNNSGGGGGTWCIASTQSVLICNNPPHNGNCYVTVVTGWQCHAVPIVDNDENNNISTASRTSGGLDCDDLEFAGITTKDDDCDTSKEDLKKVFPNISDSNASTLASVINDKGKDFGIDSDEDLWHFLAQAGHETGGFNTLNVTESTYWTTASKLANTYKKFTMDSTLAATNSNKYYAPDYLQNSSGVANVAMCCKYGNGNVASGDGYKYRGRGLFQLTWKDNYTAFKTWYNNKYDPDIDPVTTPSIISSNDTLAVLSGLWYYKTRVVDKITIDSTTTVSKVTKPINPAKKGLTDRKQRFQKAKDSINCL